MYLSVCISAGGVISGGWGWGEGVVHLPGLVLLYGYG